MTRINRLINQCCRKYYLMCWCAYVRAHNGIAVALITYRNREVHECLNACRDHLCSACHPCRYSWQTGQLVSNKFHMNNSETVASTNVYRSTTNSFAKFIEVCGAIMRFVVVSRRFLFCFLRYVHDAKQNDYQLPKFSTDAVFVCFFWCWYTEQIWNDVA